MNYLDIAIRVGAQAAQHERDFRRHFHDSSTTAAEAFEIGAKAMLAELRRTHAIVPRTLPTDKPSLALETVVATPSGWTYLIANTEVK